MKVRTNIVLETEGEKYRLYNENPSPCENCSLYFQRRIRAQFQERISPLF